MKRKVLLVTDHSFWRQDRGDRQRIAKIAVHLGANYRLSILYAGSEIVKHNLQSDLCRQFFIESLIVLPALQSSHPSHGNLSFPIRFLSKILGYPRRIVKYIMKSLLSFKDLTPLTSRPASINSTSPSFHQVALSINNFNLEVIPGDLNPDFIIIEYLRLQNLFYYLQCLYPSAKSLLDAHDVLSSRAAAFAQNGYLHWVSISRDEEAYLLEQYDAVIGISQQDCTIFRSMVKNPDILLAGHPTHIQVPSLRLVRDPSQPLSILFLASNGYANLDALEILLYNIMPAVVSKVEKRFSLLVAGSICNDKNARRMVKASSLDCLQSIGIVSDLDKLYQRIDLVSNPVRFGGGLKIKNIEALAAGCALVTTDEGSKGLPVTDPPCFICANDPIDHANALVDLISNPDQLEALRLSAISSAEHFLTSEYVYRDLNCYLRRS